MADEIYDSKKGTAIVVGEVTIAIVIANKAEPAFIYIENSL